MQPRHGRRLWGLWSVILLPAQTPSSFARRPMSQKCNERTNAEGQEIWSSFRQPRLAERLAEDVGVRLVLISAHQLDEEPNGWFAQPMRRKAGDQSIDVPPGLIHAPEQHAENRSIDARFR